MHRRGGGKFRGNNRQNQQGGRFSDGKKNSPKFATGSHLVFFFAEHDSRMSDNRHDNRMGGNHNNFNKTNRRVSFKTSGRQHNKSIDDMKIRAYLENDDEMGSELQGSSEGMRRPKGRFIRKGSPIPRGMGGGGGGKLMTNPMGWYQVTIQHGAKYDKNVLINLIMNAISPTNLIVFYFKSDPDTKSAQFYVEDYEAAEKIMRQDRKIDLPDGFKMLIRVRGSVPQVRIDAALKEKIKLALGGRYNAQTKAMDLTKFHNDPALRDVFCALSRPPIITAVIEIIAENIPDLEALSLNENKLGSIDHLKIITTKLPNLKILYLGDNKVSW
jgi:nuclear RNA export factor